VRVLSCRPGSGVSNCMTIQLYTRDSGLLSSVVSPWASRTTPEAGGIRPQLKLPTRPGVFFPMPDAATPTSMPSVFSPLAKALLDGFSEGVVVFDAEGRILYANQQARNTLSDTDLSEGAQDLMP